MQPHHACHFQHHQHWRDGWSFAVLGVYHLPKRVQKKCIDFALFKHEVSRSISLTVGAPCCVRVSSKIGVFCTVSGHQTQKIKYRKKFNHLASEKKIKKLTTQQPYHACRLQCHNMWQKGWPFVLPCWLQHRLLKRKQKTIYLLGPKRAQNQSIKLLQHHNDWQEQEQKSIFCSRGCSLPGQMAGQLPFMPLCWPSQHFKTGAEKMYPFCSG